MLERYKPESFLSCYIPGKPEPAKDKSDSFNLNIEINFNEKLYKEAFVPDLIQVLDQISAAKKNTMLVQYKNDLRNLANKNGVQTSKTVISKVFDKEKDYTLAVYNKPERFGVRLYNFGNDNDDINRELKKFRSKTRKIKGIVLELMDEDKEVIETIEKRFDMTYLLSENDNKWSVHPTIIFNDKENAKTNISFTLEMPQEIIPFVKNLKASLIVGTIGKGWLGVTLNQDTYPYIQFGGIRACLHY